MNGRTGEKSSKASLLRTWYTLDPVNREQIGERSALMKHVFLWERQA